MKNTFKLLIFAILIFPACNQADLQQQLDACQLELNEKNELLEEAQKTHDQDDPRLVHTVYLNVKDDITDQEKQELISGIKVLADIPGVYHFKTGTFRDLGDQRALSEYEVVLQMEFMGEKDYRKYQQDSVHLNFKKSVGHLLAAPPATHDFIEQ